MIKPQLGHPRAARRGRRRSGERCGRPAARATRSAPGIPRTILTTALAGSGHGRRLSIPFGLTPVGFFRQLFSTGGTYPFTTVNAYNPWALFPSDLGNSPAGSGGWICDAAAAFVSDDCGWGTALIGPFPAIVVGTVLLLAAFAVVLVVAARRPDRLTLLVALAVLALAFFVVPTRVHERYGYPFFALAVILARLLAALAGRLPRAQRRDVRQHVRRPHDDLLGQPVDRGLARDRTGDPLRGRHRDHRAAPPRRVPLGRRSSSGRRARDRLADELAIASLVEPAPRTLARRTRVGSPARRRSRPPAAPVAIRGLRWPPPRPVAATSRKPAEPGRGRTMPTWSHRPSIGEVGAGRLAARPLVGRRRCAPTARPPSSSEGGGRLDRLDLWILVLLVLASMTLRMFRLDEPYQMHFDEVYHARTATEFLQDWRYGESHDIYEWTHPHLAKYAMAAGLVLWGEDDVAATSELGVPVRASVVEPRREEPTAPGGRAGERLHIATGIRESGPTTCARGRSSPRSRLPGSRRSPSIRAGLELVVGFDDGAGRHARYRPRSTLMRPRVGVTPLPLGQVGGPVEHLFVPDDAATDHRRWRRPTRGRWTSRAGDRIGGLDLPGSRTSATAGAARRSRRRSQTSPIRPPRQRSSPRSSMARRPTTRRSCARPARRSYLGSPGSGDGAQGRRGPRSPTDDCRASRSSTSRGSPSATAAGVTFIDPATVQVSSTVALDGGGHGLALVTGIEDDRLYVTSGTAEVPTYDVIAIAGDDGEGRAEPDRRRAPAAGPRERRRLRPREPDGPHPRPRAGSRPAEGRRTVDRLRHRAARQRGLRRCPVRRRVRARRPRPRTSRPSTRPRIGRTCSCSTPRGRRRRSSSGRTPSRGGCPASSPAP